MKIFKPSTSDDADQDFEEVVTVGDDGDDALRLASTRPLAATWPTPRIDIVTRDGRRKLIYADFPFYGSHTLIVRASARDQVAALAGGQAELLPLRYGDEVLWCLHSINCIDALDEDASEIVRFPSSGRVMDIRRAVFDANALTDATVFTIPQITPSPLFLSERFVSEIGRSGLKGLVPELVWHG